MFWKKKQFWGSIIAVALLGFCLKDVRLAEIQSLGQRLDYVYLIPAVVFAFVFIIIKGLRWKVLISQQRKIGTSRAITLYSAGQILNIVMPVLTGQVGRLFLFSRNEGLRKTVVFSTIMLEVLFDSISLVIFLFVTSLAFAFPEGYQTISLVILAVTVFVLILLYLMLHYQISLEEFGRRHLRERSPGLYIGVKKFIRSFTKGMDLLHSSQHIIGTMLYSLASWAAHTLVIFFLLKSCGFSLPFAAAAAIMIINTLAVMIPITPGNAGTFELAVSSSLAAFSVARSDAVLFALALHLLDLLPIFLMGSIFLRHQKVSIREIQEKHDSEIIFDQVDEDGVFVEKEEQV
jgi:uncharacterized protein (TIRG00374 family)